MKKTLLLMVVIFALAICLTACGAQDTSTDNTSTGTEDTQTTSSESPIVIKYSAVDVADSAIGLGMAAFKDYVEEASEGRISVDLYYNGQLGDDTTNMEGVQLNTIQMTVSECGVVGTWVPAFNCMNLPYVFSDYDSYFNALDNDLRDALELKARELDYVVLGFGECGARHILNNVTEIHTPADLNGLKIRVPESDIAIAFIEALGASATPVSFNEVYTSLQQGVVDGFENPVELVYTSKFNEVSKYMTKDYHYMTPLAIMTSSTFFDGLSAEDQQIIIDGAKKQQEVNREILLNNEANYEQAMADEGMIITELTKDELQLFRDATAGVVEEYSGIIGDEVMSLINSYLAK